MTDRIVYQRDCTMPSHVVRVHVKPKTTWQALRENHDWCNPLESLLRVFPQFLSEVTRPAGKFSRYGGSFTDGEECFIYLDGTGLDVAHAALVYLCEAYLDMGCTCELEFLPDS